MAGLFRTIAAGIEIKSTDISALTWQKLWGEDMRAKSGVSVSLDSALKVSTVLACARVLANGVAQIPLKVYREGDDGSKAVDKKNPMHKLLSRRPNEWMTSFEFRQVSMFHAVLAGNSYSWINRGLGKQVKELIPLVPSVVKARMTRSFEMVYDVTGVGTDIGSDQIMHLRGPSWNGIAGLDAIQTAREAIGLAIATEEAHSKLYANGAQPGGIVAVDGAMSETSYKRLRAQIDDSREGLRNAFKMWILDQGAKFSPMAMTGVDAQHIETRRFQIEQICADLGVFPMMVGYADKTATFASAEAFFLAHVIHSLEPWIENWQQVFARDLFPDDDDVTAEFSVQGLLRGDHKTRAEFYAAGIINGYFTRNEVRKWENLNPIDGLDEPLIPLNMGTQEERAALQQDVAKAVKSMMGHNGGPQLDDAEIESKVAAVISAHHRDRRIPRAARAA
jgi:HK97 family phage portal protein